MAIDSLWSNVSLLLPLSADLLDVKGHSVTANNGAALSSAVGNPFGAGSACYFDGTNDNLTITDSADFDAGSGDFILEVWFYIAGNSTADGGGNRDAKLLANYHSAGGLALGISGNGSTTGTGVYLSYWNGSSWTTIISATTTVTQSAWHYVAVQRTGTATSLRLDNTVVATGTNSTNISLGQTFCVGGVSAHASYQGYLNGYISQVRFTRAARTITAPPTVPHPRPTISGHVYDAAASPVAKTVLVHDRNTQLYLGGANSDPSTGLYTFYPPDFGEVTVARLDELADPAFNQVVLLLPFSSDLLDVKGHSVTAIGGVSLSSAVGNPFGSGSACYFDGTDDYLSLADSSDWSFTGAYTIEFWLYVVAVEATGSWLVQQSDGLGAYCPVRIDIDSARKIDVSGSATNSSWLFTGLLTSALSLGQWYHVAVADDGTTFRVFVNGAVEASRATWSKTDIAQPLLIGGGYSGGDREANCYLSNVRITKGSARYTSSFSVPTAGTQYLAPTDGGSGENAIIYDRVTPGSP